MGVELLSQFDDFQNAYENAMEVLASNDSVVVKGDELVKIIFDQVDNFLQDIKRYSSELHFK